MKKTFYALTFFLSISGVLKSQDKIAGNWYMFSRNRVVKLSVRNDTLSSAELNFALEEWDREEKPEVGRRVTGQFLSHGNIYISVFSPASTRKEAFPPRDTSGGCGLDVFKVIEPGRKMIWILNEPDSVFRDTIAIKNFILSDTGKKYGFTLYSENEIHHLQKLRNISEMTTADFKRYTKKILALRWQFDSLSKLQAPSNRLLYYGYSILRSLFAELNYNPLVTGRQFDAFYKRFEKNPATKEEIKELEE